MWSAFEFTGVSSSTTQPQQQQVPSVFQVMMWNMVHNRPITTSNSTNPAEEAIQKQLCASSLLHQALNFITKRPSPGFGEIQPLPPIPDVESGGNSPPSFINSTSSYCENPPSNQSLPQTNWVPPFSFLPPIPTSQSDSSPPIDLSKERPSTGEAPKKSFANFSIPHLLGQTLADENTRPTKTCFECSFCGRSYVTKTGLQRHQNQCRGSSVPSPDSNPDAVSEESPIPSPTSNVSRQYSCHVCAKIYYSMSALKMHIRTHTLPCKCHVCGKAFSRMWLLNGHLRTHTGEKPFSCRVCARAFADRSNLRAHMQTHSEVKRYRCEECGKTFSRMGLLTKHQRSGCAFSAQTTMSGESSCENHHQSSPTSFLNQ